MHIIQTSDITKKYSGHTALNKVSISVPENSIFGLLGPNGAGKTSFIRILTQIISPDQGEVLFRDQKLSPGHIAEIGYLPEERGLYKKMRVGEQLIYLSRLKGVSLKESKEKLNYWLGKMELSSWRDNTIQDLSKGMQQKVQFIAAVMHDPKLIILDEPFSGFDPINAELIKNEILEFKKKGAAVILSTHRMESVEELCDHIALIHRSEKILDGPVTKIKQQFKTDRYLVEGKGFIKESDKIKMEGEEKLTEGKVRVRIRVDKNIPANEVLREVMDTMEINSFNEEIPSMHDIFIQKVKGANE